MHSLCCEHFYTKEHFPFHKGRSTFKKKQQFLTVQGIKLADKCLDHQKKKKRKKIYIGYIETSREI